MRVMTSDQRLIYGHPLLFDSNKHAYTWAGEFVPGVTTILQCISKPALVPWAASMASYHWLNEVKKWPKGHGKYLIDDIALELIHKGAKSAHRKKAQDAADIGQNIHNYAECFFKKQPLPEVVGDQAKRGVEAFHKWIDAHNVEVLDSERRVFSKEFYYAGTTDFVAKVDGVLGVGDIKTSSGIYPEMRFQTAAYQNAIQEEDNMTFDVRWIVRFDKKTGEFEAKPFYDFNLDFAGFKAALSLHRTLKTIGAKK